jgi:hypothetical protein
MKPHHDFRSVKSATLLLPDADTRRVGLIAAGKPDVLGLEHYARKLRDGCVKHAVGGAFAPHRLDRRDGGYASEQIYRSVFWPGADRPLA